MPQVLPPQGEEILRNDSQETKVISTEIEMPPTNIMPNADKRVIVVTPAYDFGGGSAVAKVRIKAREA
jgi:hypothetical protein